MLVFTVKKNGCFQIGEAIICVREVKGNHVRLAIEAPKDVPIIRDAAKVKEAKA